MQHFKSNQDMIRYAMSRPDECHELKKYVEEPETSVETPEEAPEEGRALSRRRGRKA